MIQFLFKVLSRLLGFVCTAITLIPFFMGTSTFNDFLLQLKLTQGQFVCACIVMLLVVSGVCYAQHKSDSKKAADCGDEFGDFHEKLLATLFELRKDNTTTPPYSTHTAFYSTSKLHCHELCNHIAKFLKNKFGKDFSVCIKMIDRKSIEKAKRTGRIGDAEVYTFCRGGQAHTNREVNEKSRALYNTQAGEHFCVPIKDNSDFYSILSDDELNRTTSLFACSNLRMNALLSRILGRPEYRNSTPNYWKYYKSTVVVPIRVEKKFADPKEDEALEGIYQTVGFLCVDYKKTLSTAVLNELTGYIKGFGESFYALFHEIGIMDRKIAQIQAKNECAKGGANR